MKVIVGLGNPGKKYENTRHNFGFIVLNQLAKKHRIDLSEKDASFVYGFGRFCKQKILLAKPTTYMNESGKAISRILNAVCKDNLPAEDFIVLHDEIDLPLGQLRIKQGGGDAGHRGLQSITSIIGENYFRLRLGVGKPKERKGAKDYVLDAFLPQEKSLVQKISDTACQAVEELLVQGLQKTQGHFHSLHLEIDQAE